MKTENTLESSPYQVSVITPFHNVDLTMFEACRKSVQAQTIGFDNIQWVIILHNCSPNYRVDVPALFPDMDNVVIRELNNDCHTPSSPRNYGLQFATAPYIAYLDGDDSFTPWCLETAVKEIRKAQAQVLCFRREYEMQQEGLSVLTETILWNQALERIIVEKGHWDTEKMFNGIFGMVTSKLFDRVFLLENAITFDETIPYAEDVAYSIQALANADRICYLPQMIGYHYYINGDSLVQSNAKSGSTLIAYARGMAKIFELFRKYGIETDSIQGLCMQEAFFILGSDSITVEERREIRNILGSYVMEFELLSPNKVRDEESCRTMFHIPREVILNPDNPYQGPYVRGAKDGSFLLNRILIENAGTDYGSLHSFGTIRTIEAYQFRVPLNTAESIRNMVALQTRIGEKNVLTSYPVLNYFSLPGGDLLPNTKEHSGAYVQALAETLSGRKNLLLASAKNDYRITNDNLTVVDLHTLLLQRYLYSYLNHHPEQKKYLCSERGTYSLQGRELYCRLLEDALLETELEQIVSFDTREIAEALGLLTDPDIAASLIEKVSGRNEERGKEIEQILRESRGENFVRKLWPKLVRTVGFGSGELYEHTRRMKGYTGDLPHNHGYYYTEEALLGRAVEDDSERFVNYRPNCFFELLPLNGEKAIPLNDASPDTPYQLVVTNRAGLYRYVTDHFVYIRRVGFGEVEMEYTIY